LLLGIEMLKRETTTPLRTAPELESFTVNFIAAGETSKNPGMESTQNIPAGKATNEDAKRSSSVPSKIRGFTLRADKSWRKGDTSQGRDPWRPEVIAGDWKEAVYPQWWFDPDQGSKTDCVGDELDLKIEKKKIGMEQTKISQGLQTQSFTSFKNQDQKGIQTSQF
jgi:hypothetical protein